MIDEVLNYCNSVLDGTIPASTKIKQAAKRELDDRKRSQTKEFPFYFDLKEANKSIKFISLVPKTDGSKLEMASFQKWIVGSLAGWRRKDNHNRRYRNAFITMARKNSKTYLVSALGIQALLLEKKPAKNSQIVFVANTLKQSKIAYNMLSSELRQIAQQSPHLRNILDIKKKQITRKDNDSWVRAYSSKPEGLDGLSASGLAVIDEFWGATDDKAVQSLKQAQAQEKNSLLAIVSTSGTNLHAPMKVSYYDYYTEVLAGKKQDDTTFIAIYELDDPEKDVQDVSNWIKANPLLESKEVAENMIPKLKADYETAQQTNNITDFLTKSMNAWYQANEDSFIKDEDYSKAILTPKPDITGRDVVIGVDLSKSNDISSLAFAYRLDNGSWYADSYSFIATKGNLPQKMKVDKINYEALARAGYCEITTLQSGIIDYDRIAEYLLNHIKRCNLNVLAVCYDNWQSGQLIGRLETEGLPLIAIRQYEKELSEPTKNLREAMYSGVLHVTPNELLRIAAQNAVLHYNMNGAVRLDKMRGNEKIDPLASLIDAWVYIFNQRLQEQKSARINTKYEDPNLTF